MPRKAFAVMLVAFFFSPVVIPSCFSVSPMITTDISLFIQFVRGGIGS